MNECRCIDTSPLEGSPVTVAKSELVKPSSSLSINVLEIVVSSSKVPVVSPSIVSGSSTAFTVMLISWLVLLPSSSVIVTVNVSVPWKFSSGV